MTLNRKAKKEWRAVSGVLLNDDPRLDANEHVGLLTVIAGARQVAVFLDIAEEDREKLIPLLREVRLTPLVAMGPEPVHDWQSPHPPEITSIFRERNPTSALWVCRDQEAARTIAKGVDQITAGLLLGYPRCCIDAHQQEKAAFEDAVVRGWIRELGPDPLAIAQAWRQGRKVRIDFESPERIPRSESEFPFVQHIACEACLTPGDTPTALLNIEYEKLIAEIDPGLHDYLQRLGKRRMQPDE